MKSPQEQFERFLKSKGLRNSYDKSVVLTTVSWMNQFFNIHELMAILDSSNNGQRYSRSTVPRIMMLLEEAIFVVKLKIDGVENYRRLF